MVKDNDQRQPNPTIRKLLVELVRRIDAGEPLFEGIEESQPNGHIFRYEAGADTLILSLNTAYTIPPRTRTITIPVGETEEPAIGTQYWIPTPAGCSFARAWRGIDFDRRMLAVGMIYLAREKAEAASRAIYGEAE